MPTLLFLHGIGGVRQTEQELKLWRDALIDGARAAGHSSWAATVGSADGPRVAFINYSATFYTENSQGPFYNNLSERQATILLSIFQEAIDVQIDQHPGDSAQRPALIESRARLVEASESQGPLDLLRRLINVATVLVNMPPLQASGQWLTARAMVGDLAQVARYLARDEKDQSGESLDQRIRTRVTNALGQCPTVLVAHSLGSVVAYEALHTVDRELPLLVTIGSPIALRVAVLPHVRPSPPRTPECVGRWLNFWDRDDIIAAQPILERVVQANSRGVLPESKRVDSDGMWVHSATKYLRQPGVAGPIAEYLRS